MNFKKLLVVSMLSLPFLAACGGSTTSSDSQSTSAPTTTSTSVPQPTTSVEEKVTVKFVSEDQTVTYQTVEVGKGKVPVYTGDTPKKEDPTIIYKFQGWKLGEQVYSGELPAVSVDTTFVASFIVEHEAVSISWHVESVVTPSLVKYGTVPEFPGEEPTKPATPAYSYDFSGWSDSEGGEVITIPAAVEDADYYAIFEATPVEYTVSFDVNGEVTDKPYNYGDTPDFGSIPTKPSTAEYTYEFTGWQNGEIFIEVGEDLPAVTEDVTYVAQFEGTKVEYAVSFIVEGVSTVKDYKYGETPVYEGTPTKPSTEQYDYEFTGWNDGTSFFDKDDDLPAVTKAVTYTAVFEENIKTFTITIASNNENFGSVDTEEVEEVPYGTVITASTNVLTIGEEEVTATPTAATAQYTYSFVDWSGIPSSVTGPVTITANFAQTLNKYDITIATNNANYGSVDVTKLSSIDYGTAITVDGATLTIGGTVITATPTAQTAEFTYSFVKWEGVTETVSGATNITAVFKQETRKYAVKINLIDMESEATQVAFNEEVAYSDQLHEFTAPSSVTGFVGTVPNLPVLKYQVHGALTENIYYSGISGAWDGTSVASSYEGGTGTQADPYLIASAEQWAYLKSQVTETGDNLKDTYFKLTKSINLNSKTCVIGSDTVKFDGHIDGNNCCILNAAGYALFHRIGGDSSFSNLTITGAITGADNIGAIARVSSGHPTFTNCKNYASVTGSSTKNTGFIAGFIGSGFVTLEKCYNYGNIKAEYTFTDKLQYGSNNIGGLVGSAKAADGTGSITINNSRNYASVFGGSLVGGLVGSTALANSKISISNSENFGDVTSKYNPSSSNCYGGGILGGTNVVGAVANISKTTNYGSVEVVNTRTGTAYSQYAGGIVAGNLTAGLIIQITDCVNKGAVTAPKYAGGILGFILSASGNVDYIRNCINFGEITATISYAGGIAGYLKGPSGKPATVPTFEVSNCINNGDITAGAAPAGICACTECSMINTFDKCVNNGTITCGNEGATGYAAGILGWARTSAFISADNMTLTGAYDVIKNCTNNGDIILDTIGGSGGILAVTGGITKTYIENCNNYGDITGGSSKVNSVGGIFGMTTTVNTTQMYFKNNSNFGNITIGGVGAGGIIGKIVCTAFFEDGFEDLNWYNEGIITAKSGANEEIGIDNRTKE